jgi:photosystem II stability/assembly factor-like uncharacterized protein
MRLRIWLILCAGVLLLTSTAWAQRVEPKRLAPPPSYPPNRAAVNWPEFKPRPAPVASMKLLAPDLGWALSLGRLLRTENGGISWKDITPTARNSSSTHYAFKDGEICSTFFLDGNHSWILFSTGEPDVSGGLRFVLASTTDGGGTWSVEPLGLPEWANHSSFNGGGWITFSDPDHGWVALTTGLRDDGSGGVYATSDGGRSWASPSAPNHRLRNTSRDMAGPITMVTPQFGWLIGGGANEDLYVTRDGAKTWQRIDLDAPLKTDQMREYERRSQVFWSSVQRSKSPKARERAAEALSQRQSYAAYDLPVFKGPQHGNVSVTYPGVVVLFATNDGGVTWKPDRILTGLQQHSIGTKVVSAVTDSTWITGATPGKGTPHLRKLDAGANVTDTTMPAPEASGILQMSFVSPSQGWVLTSEAELLSTTDSGASWTDISPPR